MMTTTIRRAVPDDLDAVVAVGRLTWPATYAAIAGDDYVQMGLAKWWTPEQTRPLVDSGRTFVAEMRPDDSAADGSDATPTIVGIASTGLLGKEVALYRLYVLPDYHGQGLGTRLLAAVLDDISRGSHTRLWLSYLEGNTSAERFYAKHGFVEQRRESSGPGIPDSIWLMRELERHDEETS